MKKIDILNKIANGEEPKIKYDNIILKYNKKEERFIDKDGLNSLYEFDFSELNDEIEIIEEEKKDNFTGWKMYQDGKEVCSMDCSVEEKKIPEKLDVLVEVMSADKIGALTNEIGEIQRKFNQLIDYLKSKGE